MRWSARQLAWTLPPLTGLVTIAAVAGPVLARESSVAAGVPPEHTAPPHVIFTIHAPRIIESSSLVTSTAHRGLVYTANDSGDGPFVYVLDRSGCLVGTTTLKGVDPVDIEAMAGGTDGSLVVADIGDNDAVRSSVAVYRILQPLAGDHTVTPQDLTLRYVDGPHNVESVVYDATDGRVFVVTKQLLGRVYATPPDAFSHDSAVLRPLAPGPVFATDATLLPGGHDVVVRSYASAVVYRFPSWDLLTSFGLPMEQQGESVTGVPGRPSVIWVGSEGASSAVWAVTLPAAVSALGRPPSTPVRTTTSGSSVPSRTSASRSSADPGPRGSTVEVVGVGAGMLVVAAGAAVLLVRRRRAR